MVFASTLWIGLHCEYLPTDKTDNRVAHKIKYYIHEKNNIIKDENLKDLTAEFTAEGIGVNLQNPQLGPVKILILPGYKESTLFVQSNGAQFSYFKGTCQSSSIDNCDLYPEACYPSSNRGF